MLHHGQDLVHGGGLHVHMEGKVMLQKQPLVKGKGAGAAAKAHKGAGLHVPEPPGLRRQITEVRTAEQDLPEGEKGSLPQGLLHLDRRGDHGAVHLPVEQGLHSPGGGVVGDPQVDAGIVPVKGVKAVQKEQMQSRFAGGDGNAAGLQAAIRPNLIFP